MALQIVDVELGDVVDVPLDLDLLVLPEAELVVSVEDSELGDALVGHTGRVRLHEQHRRILPGRCRLFIAGAVGEQLARGDPLLLGVRQAPVLPGAVVQLLPLRPDLIELLHGQQLPALQHTLHVLVPLGVGLGAGEGTGV